MKTIRNEAEIVQAKELLVLIEARKIAEKRETELKTYFKTKYPNETTLKLGETLINLTEKERLNIDKLAVLAFVGTEKFKTFETVTTYVQVDVKKA